MNEWKEYPLGAAATALESGEYDVQQSYDGVDWEDVGDILEIKWQFRIRDKVRCIQLALPTPSLVYSESGQSILLTFQSPEDAALAWENFGKSMTKARST